MMKWVFGIMIILSVIFGISTGRIDEVSNAALEEGAKAIELFLYLLGGMCVWGGIMRIADKSGLTGKLSSLFKPIAKLIFKNLNFNGKAFKAISMNVAANLLGLGNAATPLGIEAMHELEKEDRTKDSASDNMIVFTVLNTASITLIPTTVASLRLKHGSLQPFDILPCVWITSLLSVGTGLILALILNKTRRKK
ncbi:MAG: spore maturation protein A [Oscillospiraceae bacterium]|nr:spore maturation protein A [Oscillospiraceae bacterium]